MRPTAWPCPILRLTSLRICTRAAPRPSDRLTLRSAIAEPLGSCACKGWTCEVSFMRSVRRRPKCLSSPLWSAYRAAWSIPVPRAILPSRSYGTKPSPVKRLAVALVTIACALMLPASLLRAEPAARPVKIVVLGDSLSAGLGLGAADAFPAKLQRALTAKGVRVDIVNAGVSGDTAAGGLARLDWSVPDGTDAVVVELGANDALRGLDPKVTQAALGSILKRLTARQI